MTCAFIYKRVLLVSSNPAVLFIMSPKLWTTWMSFNWRINKWGTSIEQNTTQDQKKKKTTNTPNNMKNLKCTRDAWKTPNSKAQMNPFIWHSHKGKTRETENRGCQGQWVMGEVPTKGEEEILGSVGTLLYPDCGGGYTICVFVKTHRTVR